MSIHPLLLPILQNIKFADRYKEISLKYQFFNERFSSFEVDEVKKIIESFGYITKYNKNENFFKISEKVKNFQIQFNISLKGGIIEFIYGITKDGERLKIGSSVCTTIELLTNSDFTAKPIFRSYEDLKEIFKDSFEIFEDFKHELLTMNIN